MGIKLGLLNKVNAEYKICFGCKQEIEIGAFIFLLKEHFFSKCFCSHECRAVYQNKRSSSR
jgi:hypothetical protein